MKGVKKVLVAVDGSMAPARHGIRLAQDEGTWVTVLKVIPEFEGDLDLTGVKSVEDVLYSGGMKTVEEVGSLAKAEGALVKTRLERGEVDKKIVEVAREERCDLIVMGAQKRSFFKRLIGANVVEKVINSAPCPVFIV